MDQLDESTKKISNRKKSAQKRYVKDRGIWQKYYTVRHARLQRGHEFSLSKEDFFSLSKGHCFYCGSEPISICYPAVKKNGRKSKTEYDKERPSYCNGIDRKDSSKGYNLENCVSCCKNCNYAKRSLPLEDFKKWLIKVCENLGLHA